MYNKVAPWLRVAPYFQSIPIEQPPERTFKILSLPQTDRGIDGLVYLNKVYEKYITLVGNSAILNPMNKHDK